LKISGTIRLHLKSRLLRAFTRHARNESGQSLVETAVSMLIVLMLIFGVIEGCWGVYSFHYLANAAHEAARYAIVRGHDWIIPCDSVGGWSASMCTASPANIANFAANRGFPGINIDPNNDVCVEYFAPDSMPDSGSLACNPNTGPNSVGDIVQVTINNPFKLTLPGLPAYTWNLSSTSRMVIAQ
jgi:hypothetical protein